MLCPLLRGSALQWDQCTLLQSRQAATPPLVPCPLQRHRVRGAPAAAAECKLTGGLLLRMGEGDDASRCGAHGAAPPPPLLLLPLPSLMLMLPLLPLLALLPPLLSLSPLLLLLLRRQCSGPGAAGTGVRGAAAAPKAPNVTKRLGWTMGVAKPKCLRRNARHLGEGRS